MSAAAREAELIRLRTLASDLRDRAAFADSAAARAAERDEAARIEQKIRDIETQPAQ